jgi:phage baseplate assembly protein W
MKTTTPILSELQTKQLGDTARAFIDGKDFNFKGNNITAEASQREDFVLDGTAAIKNKVMFWLTSAEGDYVREPGKGGVLWSLLGKSLTDANAARIKKDIQTFFSANFQGELNLLGVDIIKDIENRRWKIELLVKDPIRREIFNLAVGVTI